MVAAFSISMVSLVMSFMVIVWSTGDVTEDTSFIIEEIGARLDDLEEEHDYLLDTKIGESISETIDLRPTLCSLLPDPGPCGSQVTRWYYLPREEDCIQFPWGGCQGNDNNFVSIHQCRAACHVPQDKQVSTSQRPILPIPTMSTVPSLKENFSPSDCKLTPDSGPCQDRITRFYYDGGECQR